MAAAGVSWTADRGVKGTFAICRGQKRSSSILASANVFWEILSRTTELDIRILGSSGD